MYAQLNSENYQQTSEISYFIVWIFHEKLKIKVATDFIALFFHPISLSFEYTSFVYRRLQFWTHSTRLWLASLVASSWSNWKFEAPRTTTNGEKITSWIRRKFHRAYAIWESRREWEKNLCSIRSFNKCFSVFWTFSISHDMLVRCWHDVMMKKNTENSNEVCSLPFQYRISARWLWVSFSFS